MFREKHPGIQILVHPECPQEVFELADESGSTGKIIQHGGAAPPGSKWAIGTELHLVNRLKKSTPSRRFTFYRPWSACAPQCTASTCAHLCWSLENYRDGTPTNIIEVDEETSKWSLVALERMLEVK